MTVKVLIIILSSIKSIVPKLTLLPPKYLINGKKIAKLVNVIIFYVIQDENEFRKFSRNCFVKIHVHINVQLKVRRYLVCSNPRCIIL